MKHFKLPAILALLLFCNFTFARKVTETLSSSKGDKVSITYEITQKNGKVSICFSNTSKTLGNHGRKYQKADEIVVLFFDRKGGYDSDVHFSGEINTNPFTIPTGLEYKKSEDGYYIIGQSTPPKLTFDMTATATVDLSIPIYLAWHPKRGKYEVFQHCGNLDIAIAPETSSQTPNMRNSIHGQQTETFEYYEETGTDYDEMARSLINKINTTLEWMDENSSFGPELINQISALKDLEPKVNNRNLKMEIRQTLSACDEKREELSRLAEHQDNINKQEEAKVQQEAEERQMYLSCMDIQTCEHYLELYPNGKYKSEVETKLKKLEDEKKEATAKQQKRTIWMIIGGGLMAALLFVGNQAMQSFRNIRTQRSIMEMQQDVTRKATGMAKRRAKSLIHNKTHQAANVTRNKGRDLMQKGVEKTKTISLKNKSNNHANGAGGANKAQTTNVKKKTNSSKQISI